MIQLIASLVCLVGAANSAANSLVESLKWSGQLSYTCPGVETSARPRGIAVTTDRLFLTLETDAEVRVSLAYIQFNDISPIRLHPYPSCEGSVKDAHFPILSAAHIRVDSCLRLWVVDELQRDQSVLHIFNLTDNQLLLANHSLPLGDRYIDMFVESVACNQSYAYLTHSDALTVLLFDGRSISRIAHQLTADGGVRVLASNATDMFYELNRSVHLQPKHVFNLSNSRVVIESADWVTDGAVAMARGALFFTDSDNALRCWSQRNDSAELKYQLNISRTLGLTIDEDGVLWLLAETADGFSVLSRNMWDLTINTRCQIWVSKPGIAEETGLLVSTVLFAGLLVLLNCTCLGGVGTMVWKVVFDKK